MPPSLIHHLSSLHIHIRVWLQGSLNFFLPSIILRRLHQKKLDLFSTIKCRHLKNRIMSNYTSSKDGNFTFVLYNNTNGCATTTSMSSTSCGSTAAAATGCDASSTNNTEINSYNVLKKILKEDGCTLVTLEGKLSVDFCFSYKHLWRKQGRGIYMWLWHIPKVHTVRPTTTTMHVLYIFVPIYLHIEGQGHLLHTLAFLLWLLLLLLKLSKKIRENSN